MNRLFRFFAALLMTLPCGIACSAASDIGAIVMHGKWGNPGGNMTVLVSALRNAGFLVSAPEMPWSGRRLYDKGVESADEQIDAEIARLHDGGAKKIFVVGQSLGAAFAIHYATRTVVDGIVAIAPGHRPETGGAAQMFRDDITKARAFIAAGKADESIGFNDPNSGGRRNYVRAPASSFLSYFDPDGAMNMTRNAATVKPEIAVLWLVPTREEQPARDSVVLLFKRLPTNPGTRFVEPESDHLGAPAASARLVVDWIRDIASKN